MFTIIGSYSLCLACIVSTIMFATLRKETNLLATRQRVPLLAVVLRCRSLFAILLIHRPPCSNGPAVAFMCHAFRFCAMSFVSLYSFMSSAVLSNHLILGLPFFSFPALACLTSSWWYPPLPSLTRGHTISVVSF